jgi:hypothetical protein
MTREEEGGENVAELSRGTQPVNSTQNAVRMYITRGQEIVVCLVFPSLLPMCKDE